MSQFRDTFTKEGKQESVLDYDDNAFIFFGSTLLLCVLLPWTFFAIRLLLFPKIPSNRDYPVKSSKGHTFRYCQCSFCLKKVETAKKDRRMLSKRLSLPMILHLVGNGILWCTFFYLYSILSEMSGIHAFDPFEVLGVDSGATVEQIRRAYRAMSLKHHPDANPNDPTAAAKFLLLSKAVRVLTDERAKRNYELYGNPDGPSIMKIGIGLPRFLVKEEYQLVNLSVFFLILLVVIPVIFIWYYRSQKRYSPNGVQVDTLRFLFYFINDGTRLRSCPEILASCAESCQLPLKASDNDDMKKLLNYVTDVKKRMFSAPIVVRNYFLILAHLQRLHEMMSPSLRNALNRLLSESTLIIPSMIEIAIFRNWLMTAKAFIEFRRCLVQAVYFSNSSLLQIPHFDESVVNHCNVGKNAVRHLSDFLHQNSHERKGVNQMSEQQLRDIDAFCAHVSDMQVTASISVEDEEFIVVGDIATCLVQLTRKNLKEGEAVGPVHSMFFPDVKFEEWWIFVSDKNGHILGFSGSKKLEKVVEERIQFEVTSPGKHTVHITAICDSYLGIDQAVNIEYTANPADKVKRTFYVHPEDVELDNEPTLFQQMMGENMYGYSSDEEEEEANDGIKSKLKSEKAKPNEIKNMESSASEAHPTTQGGLENSEAPLLPSNNFSEEKGKESEEEE